MAKGAPAKPTTASKGKVSKGKGSPNKITKAKKDKDAPKKARSAYIIFTSERRPQLLVERPDLKSVVTECSKIMGGEWSSMSEAQKEKYQKLAEEDKVRAAKEKAAYEKGQA